MKKCILYVLFFAIQTYTLLPSLSDNLESLALLESVTSRLPQERIHNLVILHDVSEYFDNPNLPVITHTLAIALKSNHLTLCSKLLWYNLQNKAKELQKTISSLQQKKQKFLINDVSLGRNFALYQDYLKILSLNFTCKEINDDFILFIPQQLQQAIDLNPQEVTSQSNITAKDLFLGLRYQGLRNFPFQNMFSEKDVPITSKKRFSQETGKNPHLHISHALHNALQTLIVNRSNFQIQYKHFTYKILPEFQVCLIGHGSNTAIASLNIKSKPEKKSEFLQFLYTFQNNLNTKAMGILSCFGGGKKIKDAYNIKSQFNSPELKRLSYPLISIGATYSKAFLRFNEPTTIISQATLSSPKIIAKNVKTFNDNLTGFFAFLSKTPPDYTEAANVLGSHAYKQKDYSNYAMIKFPNTEWFTPITYQKRVKPLTQIAMATADKPIKIFKQIEAILLGANNYPQPLEILGIPTFIPSNSLNQNYNFNEIHFINEQNTLPPKTTPRNALAILQDTLKTFFAIQQIREPINITIKILNTSNVTFENVHIFMYREFDSKEKQQNGYSYTNPIDKKRYIAHWDFDSTIPLNDAQPRLENPKQAIRASFASDNFNAQRNTSVARTPNTSSVPNPEFMKNLSSILAKKQISLPKAKTI